MKPAIRVEGLGKQYRIGAPQAAYSTLRESVVDAVRSPFKRLGRNGNGNSPKIWAIQDITFTVKRGDVVGIIGRNGGGKTTLLKVLSRVTEPTVGEVDLYGRVGSLLEVGTGFHPELTGRENTYLNGAILGMGRREIDRKFDEILAFAEIEKFIDTPVKHYSNGMYMRLAFAVAAHLNTEILLVDEVLAVGDEAFQQKCLGKMDTVAKEGRTVLFVSHNTSAIARLCTKAIVLDREILFAGDVPQAIDLYTRKSRTGEQRFDDNKVRGVSVRQVDENIEILVDYKTEHAIQVPEFSFVVNNSMGVPVFGGHSATETITPPPVPKNEGRIRILVDNPKLSGGTYRLSIWFDDGTNDVFRRLDCVIFDIVNTSLKSQLPVSIFGSVSASCSWHLE